MIASATDANVGAARLPSGSSPPSRSLRIAWLGPVPSDGAGVPGVAAELLFGLAQLGHRIDCFFATAGHELPARLASHENITFIWGTSGWHWDSWYSRTRVSAFASGLLARGIASLRLRRQIARRHARERYDVVYQFSNIETLAVPPTVVREIPLVIHPETHVAGELRHLIAERDLGLRCQPRHVYLTVVAIMSLRALVQRVRIRRAHLLVCISPVFRDHIVRDYRFAATRTVVVPNPVRLERFASLERRHQEQATVLVLGRIAVRKGIQDVVAAARAVQERDVGLRFRIVGGPSLWSDYTRLLDDLPCEGCQYAGSIAASQVPAELAGADLLLQPSRYEPFALTVAEALSAGVPVVASTEVGAIEGVSPSVAAPFPPGDVEAMIAAIIGTLERVRTSPEEIRRAARAEAARLFAPARICAEISSALQQLITSGVGAPKH